MYEKTNGQLNNSIRVKEAPYIKSVIVFILMVMLTFIQYKHSTGGYSDEILGVFSIIFILLQRKKINKTDIVTLMLIGFAMLLGLISNIMHGIISDYFSIGIDLLSCSKVVLAYMFLKYFISREESQSAINLLLPVAKLYAIAAFLCSIASQFLDTRMTTDVRYGIKSFRFIYVTSVQFVYITIFVFGIFVFTDKLSKQQRLLYYFLIMVSILMATKSSAIIVVVLFLFLSYYFKKFKKINIFVVIVMLGVIILMSRYQIETYLLNEESPRRLFWDGAVKLANRYFPLGSGFSTFGSNEAAVHYSPLYREFGFHKQWGMSPTFGPFLADNFWQMAIGQFGWIGGILYIASFFRLFYGIMTTKNLEPPKKAFLYALCVQFLIQALGAAILSSSYGQYAFLGIALFMNSQDSTKENTSYKKMRIKV